MPTSMKMIFTDAGPLNRWGTPARTNTSVTNSRAVRRRASHRMNALQAGNSGNHNTHTNSGSGGGNKPGGGGNVPTDNKSIPTSIFLTPCQLLQLQYKDDLNGASNAWYSFLECATAVIKPDPSDFFTNKVYNSAGLIRRDTWEALPKLQDGFPSDKVPVKMPANDLNVPCSLQGTKEEIDKKYSAKINNDAFNTVGFYSFSYHLFFNKDGDKCIEANNVPDFIKINGKEYVFATHAVETLIGDILSGFLGHQTSQMPTFYDKIKHLSNWVKDDDYILLPSQK